MLKLEMLIKPGYRAPWVRARRVEWKNGDLLMKDIRDILSTLQARPWH